MYQDFLFFQRNLLFWFFVMMDLLKRLLFKRPTLFSNQRVKLEILWPGKATQTHQERHSPEDCSFRNILASVADQ